MHAITAQFKGSIHSVRMKQVIFGRRHVGIMSAEPVGNYGVK